MEAAAASAEAARPASTPEIIDLDYAWCDSLDAVASGGGSTERDPISVEDYSDQRDIQCAIAASLLASSSSPTTFDYLSSYIDLEDYEDDAVLAVHLACGPETPPSAPAQMEKKPFSGNSVTEKGESSSSRTRLQPFFCEICADSKDADDGFRIQGCRHTYCTECISRYVASKLQESVTSIKCPEADCCAPLEPEHCRSILPREVFDRWGNALCEALILGSEKFYCPFKDCSAVLINDGAEAVKESECPHCNRMFCAQCQVPWHDGIDCKDFQGLAKNEREREDIMLSNLAKKKKWKRCPKCHFYVEKVHGCMFVRCRCGVEFCYTCGTKANISHYCMKCKA